MDGLRIGAEPRSGLRAYVLRHWRGGFSLGFAFWVNGALLGLFAELLLGLRDQAVEALGLSGHGGVAAVLLVISLAAYLAFFAWQATGVARSASAHEERGGRRLWALLARCVLVVAAIGVPLLLMDEFATLRALFA